MMLLTVVVVVVSLLVAWTQKYCNNMNDLVLFDSRFNSSLPKLFLKASIFCLTLILVAMMTWSIFVSCFRYSVQLSVFMTSPCS